MKGKLIELEQGTPEWLEARKGVPTASQASRIVSSSGVLCAKRRVYIMELCAESIDPEAPAAFTGNAHTKRGNELEPVARQWFADSHGVEARQVGMVMHDHLVAGCSPDALLFRQGDAEPYAGLEIKCPSLKTHLEYLLEDRLPIQYIQQVHWSMVITGLPWVFMSFYPGLNPLIVMVNRSDYTAKVERAMQVFCAEYEQIYYQVVKKAIP